MHGGQTLLGCGTLYVPCGHKAQITRLVYEGSACHGRPPGRSWQTPAVGPQVHASAQGLRLITFDADGTLYADGCHIEVRRPGSRGPLRVARGAVA